MIEEAINLLNEFGILSATLLMRKFKITYLEAVDILKEIVSTHTNIFMRSACLIYIDGITMPAHWPEVKQQLAVEKKIKEAEEMIRRKEKEMIRLSLKIKNKSRWKDITRP